MNSGCVARSHPAGSVSRTGSVSRLMRAVVLIAQFEDVTPVARGVVLENARQRDRAGRHFGVGEFHRTIVVEDASGGISIAAEGSPLADLYPFGIVATVRCNGLTLCDYGGKIQLGTTPGDGGAGCIPREELARYIRTEPPGGETPSAQLLTFDAVSARHIDTRVRFDDVRFADAGKTWCDTDPETGRAVATEREIVDTRGRTFTVRTAATCVYAKEPLPQGTGSLYGIIDYFAGKYTLRVTNREAEFSGTAAHSAATRPTAGRPARTTRTTQTTRTTRTMRAGVTAATPPTAYP